MEKKKIPLGRGEIVKPLDHSPAPPKMSDKDILRRLEFKRRDLIILEKLQNTRMVLITQEEIEALEKGLSDSTKKSSTSEDTTKKD